MSDSGTECRRLSTIGAGLRLAPGLSDHGAHEFQHLWGTIRSQQIQTRRAPQGRIAAS
jgi:hypothetical protein